MVWRERDYNKVADWCCNSALDQGDFRQTCVEIKDLSGLHTNWRAYSDGACRGDDRSAIGWAIYVCLPHIHHPTATVGATMERTLLVELGGMVLPLNRSSIEVELLALEKVAARLDHYTAAHNIMLQERQVNRVHFQAQDTI